MPLFILSLEAFITHIIFYNITLAKAAPTLRDVVHAISMASVVVIISKFAAISSTLEPIIGLSLLATLIIRHYPKYGAANAIATATFTLLTITFADALAGITIDHIYGFTLTVDNLRSSAVNYLIFSVFFTTYGLILAFANHWSKARAYHYFAKHNFNKFPLVIIGIFTLIALGFYWLTFNLTPDTLSSSEIIAFIMALSMILITLIIVLYARYQINKIQLKNEKKRQELNNLYIKEIEKNQKLLRSYKHDYHNVSLGLLGYLESNDLEGAKSYYHGHYKTFEEDIFKNDSRLDKLYLFNQPELKSLIWAKCIDALKKDIKLNVEVNENIDFNSEIKDILRIVGIWFDNAIDATQSGEVITIAAYTLNNLQYFIIENPINSAISLKDVMTSGYTTKGGEHGVGLETVRQIIDKNTQLESNTEITANYFKQMLIVSGE